MALLMKINVGVLAYYLIGFFVSSYHIWYYRYNEKTKSPPSTSDALGALVGPWVWPLQILKHMRRSNK